MSDEEQLPYHQMRHLRKSGLAPALPTRKEKKPLNKISPKKAAADKAEKEARGGEATDLQKFFTAAMKRMTGYCLETGLKTETKIYQYAIMSIAHILSKKLCPSVAMHPCIWVELNPDFHFKFDQMSWEERERLGCWPVIRDKLILVYPSLAPEERRHFPESVLKFMQLNEGLDTPI